MTLYSRPVLRRQIHPFLDLNVYAWVQAESVRQRVPLGHILDQAVRALQAAVPAKSVAQPILPTPVSTPTVQPTIPAKSVAQPILPPDQAPQRSLNSYRFTSPDRPVTPNTMGFDLEALLKLAPLANPS